MVMTDFLQDEVLTFQEHRLCSIIQDMEVPLLLTILVPTPMQQLGRGPHGGAANAQGNDAICVYSFALKPEEHQPSGTCNFSRIDNAELISQSQLNLNSVMFAVNYNVLRVMSGMGGLAYSN